MTYLSNLEKSVLEFQPIVEEMLDVSIGKINLKPYDPKKTRNLIEQTGLINSLPKRLGLWLYFNIIKRSPYAGVYTVDDEPNIYYNTRKSLDKLPYGETAYIAVHEMGHLAHKTHIGKEKYMKSTKQHTEFVAGYIAHKIILKSKYKNVLSLDDYKLFSAKELGRYAVYHIDEATDSLINGYRGNLKKYIALHL